MHKYVKKCALGVVATGAVLAVAAPALAATSSFGPQSWSNGQQTGRYRAHVGYHYITLSCSGGRFNIDLRVDVINNPDISEGYYSYACNSPGQLYGHYDSYLGAYRGHFMQSHSSWYGTLADNHS
jgi:hypothetical protein